MNYVPTPTSTPALKAEMDSPIAEYDRAAADFDAARAACDTPVFVALVR